MVPLSNDSKSSVVKVPHLEGLAAGRGKRMIIRKLYVIISLLLGMETETRDLEELEVGE